MYSCEPKFVPVDQRGKPSPPSLPTCDLVLPMLTKHFGEFVVLHTDGADAYRSCCAKLQSEGFTVVQDHVVHSQGQWSAFGRHAVGEDWESCCFALINDKGERRIRVIKGTQKAEGLWRHLKHGTFAIPKEVHQEDARLDIYSQSLAWRMQCCGCPYRDVLRMCLAFRCLPLATRTSVFCYGLTELQPDGRRKVNLALPTVRYCQWHLSEGSDDLSGDEENDKEEKEHDEGQQEA